VTASLHVVKLGRMFIGASVPFLRPRENNKAGINPGLSNTTNEENNQMSNSVTIASPIEGSNYLIDIAARVKIEHQAVAASLKQSVQHAIAAGELLLEAKDQIPHGQWLPWLEQHCGVTPRAAQMYMRVAKYRAAIELKYEDISHLTIADALAALAKPRLPKVRNRDGLTLAEALSLTKLKSHPLKDRIIPDYDWPNFDNFVGSIRRIGLIYPIVLYEGMILDGRARYRACLQVGVEPHFRVYDGDDPLGHIWVLDFCRTNLSPDQHAVLRLECEKLKERVPREAA
jgi:hypothetical protein